MKYINEYRIFENVEKAKKILKELNVDINNPEELEIRQWKDIKDLLKDNMGYLGKFTEMFFKENKQIETLTELYNKLKKIPKEIGNLVNLKRLDLHNNKIKNLPNNLLNLINLKDLYLSENNLNKKEIYHKFSILKLNDFRL